MNKIIYPEMYREITKDNIIERIKITEWLYLFNEVNSADMYLMIGEKKALLFDTGFGFSGWKRLIAEVTALPLTVVCSHGHDDHVLGCFQFDSAYIAEDDYELCMSNDTVSQREKQIASRRKKTPNIDSVVDRETYLRTTLKNCEFRFVSDGDVFDLGGITLRVFPVPGHSRGSIALYCKEHKALFAGDAVMKNEDLVYSHRLEISAPPQQYIRALSRLMNLDIKTVWPAHGEVPAGKELIADTREMLIDWTKHADLERDRFVVPQDAVFGTPGEVRGRFTYKGMTMRYNIKHLDEIREYMRMHGGEVE